LLATASNQLWSWDITKLLRPVKWTYFYLCVILDVFNRYVTGWMVAHRETTQILAGTLGGLDQRAHRNWAKDRGERSVSSHAGCLKPIFYTDRLQVTVAWGVASLAWA